MNGRLRLVATIVNPDMTLAGFRFRGKEKDFGGFSDVEVVRDIPLAQVINSKFNNCQIGVSGGKLVEKKTFKINSLPMLMYTGSKVPEEAYVPMDNSINLVARYVQNNENIGFRVRLGNGAEFDQTYRSILTLCRWFKPGNFQIRKSSKGNIYLCGKAGESLASIPQIVVGETDDTKKRMKSAAKAEEKKISGELEVGFDIIDIYDFIDSCHGSVIKLPSEKYEAATEGGATEVDGFTSLGIGEVASPRPMFNATKLNVNAGFKKVGVVDFVINGAKTTLTTYIYRTKSLFLRGENYVKKFGIAVSMDKEAELLRTLGRSLALEKITDPTVIQPLSQVIDAKSLAFYKVDTSKIDLISEKKRSEGILNAKQLKQLCQTQYELKLISKAVGPKGGLMKTLKDTIGPDKVAEASSKKLFGLYAMMGPEALQAITDLGIDVYSGAYTSTETKPIKKDDAKGGSSSAGDESVEIEYTYDGFYAGKITGKQVIELVKSGDTTKITPKVAETVSSVLAVKDPVKMYEAAKEVYDKVEQQNAKIARTLWIHNASMFINGNKTNIHTHDKKKWVPDESSRVKTAQVYKYTGKDLEGLRIKFKGVNI